jgi:hypothetical protein
MAWIVESGASLWGLGLAIVGGGALLGFLWWALADLLLATVDLREMLERMRRRGNRTLYRDRGSQPMPS